MEELRSGEFAQALGRSTVFSAFDIKKLDQVVAFLENRGFYFSVEEGCIVSYVIGGSLIFVSFPESRRAPSGFDRFAEAVPVTIRYYIKKGTVAKFITDYIAVVHDDSSGDLYPKCLFGPIRSCDMCMPTIVRNYVNGLKKKYLYILERKFGFGVAGIVVDFMSVAADLEFPLVENQKVSCAHEFMH